MARVIQTQIKTPLADEVLFGRLKGGGLVQIGIADKAKARKLSFVYPEGEAQPGPERALIVVAGAPRSRERAHPANTDADNKDPASEKP
jgi:ATP-dependent Clp protease ATP-binding subunit ClpA